MKTIFFAGGGTLGSVTPLLAVYQELQRITPPYQGGDRRGRVVWIGTARGPECEKVSLFPEIVFEILPEAKLPRYISLKTLVMPFVFVVAALKSISLIMKYHPQLIIGAGGFMQVPLILAGKLLGVSCFLHQIDVTPTLSNKFCAWAAKRITVNFEETAKYFPKEKTVVVGNPVFVPYPGHTPSRHQMSGHPSREGTLMSSPPTEGWSKTGVGEFGFTSQKPLLVVIGGGTGAEQLNSLVGCTIDELTKIFNIVLISGGKAVPHNLMNRIGVFVTNFVQDTYHLLERADMIVTRAGMATLTECACLGKPAVIVPIPHSHQEANARHFEQKDAAKVFWCDYGEVEQGANEFANTVLELWKNAKKKEELVRNIGKLYNGSATQSIAFEVLKTLNPKP